MKANATTATATTNMAATDVTYRCARIRTPLEVGHRVVGGHGGQGPLEVGSASGHGGNSVVLKALAFGDRVLDAGTARHGLAHAAFTLIQMHLREVGAQDLTALGDYQR